MFAISVQAAAARAVEAHQHRWSGLRLELDALVAPDKQELNPVPSRPETGN
jgi:hypothetical protein